MISLLKAHPFFKEKNIESCTLLENQGYCNENYLVVADNQKYIVRNFLRDEIDRTLEWHVLELAHTQGITAEPLVYDAEHELMVFSFLEGEHKEILQEDDIKALANVVKKLHSIPLDKQPIEIKLQDKTDEVLDAFEIIKQFPKEYVLCHNDLNPKNIFFSYDVKFIDFEYAGVNDRYFDLACVCVEFELDNEMQKKLLDTYFIATYRLKKLEAYKVIYKALVEEWFRNML